MSKFIAIDRISVKLAVVALALLAGNCDNLWAQGYSGAFLRIGVGARAKAMGNAYSAMATGVEAAYYNPAGLPYVSGKQLLASYRALSLDRQFTYVGFALPVQPKTSGNQKSLNGGFSLAWLRAGVSDIDGRNSDGQHFDDLSNSENAFMFAFALNPSRRVAFGLTAKVLWNRFPGLGIDDETISSTGVGFDFGMMVFPINWLTLGLVVKDINSKYRWNTQDVYGEDGSETINTFPKIIRYGVAFKPHWFFRNVTIAVDYEQLYKEKIFSNKFSDRFHAGAEAVFLDDIVVRAGFDDGSVTAGAGYAFGLIGKRSQLNYAFVASGDRPEEEHVFTWVFEF